MTKRELVEAVWAEHDDLTKSHVKAMLEALFEAIGDTLATEGRYTHPGFGTLTVAARAARIGRNPRTGEPVAVPASTTVRFKAAPELKNTVNRSDA